MTAGVLTVDEAAELEQLRAALRRHRWPWAPLGDLLGGTVAQARQLGVHDRQVCRWLADGLTDRMADRCALLVGRHPREVWAGWDDVGQADERRLEEVA